MIASLALLLCAAPGPVPVIRGPEALLAAIRARQQPTIVHFWATWCGSCTEEVREIQRLTEGAIALGASVLFVSLDDPARAEDVGAYLRRHDLLASPKAWAVVLDAPDPEPIVAKFNPKWSGGLPATFFLLESGVIVASHLGPTPVDLVLKEVKDRLDAKPKNP